MNIDIGLVINILLFLLGLIIGVITIWLILKNKYEMQINALQNEANIKLTSLQNQNEFLLSTKEPLANYQK
jgi:hypothetical protein